MGIALTCPPRGSPLSEPITPALALGWLSVASALFAMAVALGVLAVRPGAVMNRLLAAFLGLVALGSGSHGANLVWAGSPGAFALDSVFLGLVFPAVGILYFFVAAHGVPRPGTAFLRTRTAHWLLIAAIAAVWLGTAALGARTPWLTLVWEVFLLLAALVALVSAIIHRRATTGALRRKATTYLIAFGIHDAGFIVGLTMHLIGRARYGLEAGGADRLHPWVLAADGIIQVGMTGLILVLAWGLFRSQILDFRFRLRLGISRGAIAAVFIGSFFVVSELTAELLSERLGPVLGIVTTGLLVFGLAPLQRWGERIGNAIVDDSRPVQEMDSGELEQLLRDQYELALEDGLLSVQEMRMLDSMRDRLGIPHDVAARIQKETALALG